MQMRPRFALSSVSVILLAVVALVAGCSSSNGTENSSPLPDAATLLQNASATTRAEHSVHLLLTVNGKVEHLPVTRLDGDLTNAPAPAAQGTADITYAGMDFKDARFAVVDGTLYAALTPGDPLSSFGNAANIYDIAALLNPDTGLANLVANVSAARSVSREQIGGTDAVKIDGTVSADAVNKIAPQLEATAPMPGAVWVQENSDNALLQAELTPSEGNTITMALSDWGKPVTVAKPAA